MRVLMLSKACIVGIYQKKLELIGQQPDITLRVLVPPAWRDERGLTQLERVFVDGYELRETRVRFNGNFHLHYYPDFPQEAAAFQPDIVHIDEEPYNLATWLTLRATRKLGAKSLFFSWQNIRRYYPFPFRWLERDVLTHVDFALMGTSSAAEVWRAKGYSGPLAVVPQFGVDADLFHPSPEKESSGPVIIGYAGRLVAEKGIDLVLKALATLPNLDWRLHLVGGGPQQSALADLAAQLGITARVDFLGLRPSVEMPDIFRRFDALVIPSRTRSNWKEQYGRVILEAMASGVAVIGSDSGAIPDVVGQAGLIFPEGDVQALAAHLRTLITQPETRHQLGQRGRERVLEGYTQRCVADQTTAVYRQMMAGEDTPAG